MTAVESYISKMNKYDYRKDLLIPYGKKYYWIKSIKFQYDGNKEQRGLGIYAATKKTIVS